jgi:hypothetical protein
MPKQISNNTTYNMTKKEKTINMNNNERLLKQTSGRFIGIETFDGRKFNAKVEKVTPFYVLFRDRNQAFDLVKLAKTSICKINQKNVWQTK